MRLRALVALIAVLAASPALAGWTKLVNNGSYTGARPMFVTNSNGVYVSTYKATSATNAWVRTQSNGTQNTYDGPSPSVSFCKSGGAGYDASGGYIYQSGGACGTNMGTAGRWECRSNSASLASWSCHMQDTAAPDIGLGTIGANFGSKGYFAMGADNAGGGTVYLGSCTATRTSCSTANTTGLAGFATYQEGTGVVVTSSYAFGAWLQDLGQNNANIGTRGVNASESVLFSTSSYLGKQVSKSWAAALMRPAFTDGTNGMVVFYDSAGSRSVVIVQPSSGAVQCATCNDGAQVIAGDWRPLTATNASATYDLDGTGAKAWLMQTDGAVRYYSGGDFVRPASTALDLTLDAADTVTGWTLNESGAPFVTTAGGDVFTGSTFAPAVTLTAGAATVGRGSTTTLTWTVFGATSCTASGAADWTGSKSTSGGSATVTVSATTTYTLSCTGNGGTTTPTALVAAATTGGGRAAPSLAGSL